jgi:hypothetical protein
MSKGRTGLIRFGAVALASTAALAGVSGAAGAATSSGASAPSSGSHTTTTTTLPTTLAGIQSLAHTRISQRVDVLTKAVSKVKTAKGLGAGQGALATYLGQDIGPLQQLDSKIAADGTVQQATADYGTIFSGFRVYRLVLPAAHVDAEASRVTNRVVPALTKAAGKAQAHQTSANGPKLGPLVTNLNSQITAATNATNGLAGTVLGYTPAQWNANNNLLSSAQSSIGQAESAVKQGRKDVHQMRELLDPKSLHHAATRHGATHGPKHGPGSTTSTTS